MVWLYWSDEGSAGVGGASGAGSRDGGDEMVVEFVLLEAAPSPPIHDNKPATRVEEVVEETAELAPASEVESPEANPVGREKLRPTLSANETHSSPNASGEEGAAASGDDLQARYRAAVRQTIAAYWRRQTGEDLPKGCTLKLEQAPGGQVLSATVGACGQTDAVRLSLEAAALMAQPLPYAGFETVFAPQLGLDL